MLLSLGIIALNEEEYLPSLLEDILHQTFSCSQIDLLLIDSLSSDRTKIIMEQFKSAHIADFYNIRIFDNIDKWLANGWNIFIANAVGDILIKVDAHSHIPDEFVDLLVEGMKNNDYGVLGGKRPTILKDNSLWSKILLEAENALFGSGIAVFRTSSEKRLVKSVFHGAYRKDVFLKVGNFNEKLRRTEDNEFHYRIRTNGYKIMYDPSIVSYQYARPTFRKMLVQKYLNGYWIGKTVWCCPRCLSLYYFAPLGFVLVLFFSIFRIYMFPMLVLLGLYGVFDLTNSIFSSVKNKNIWLFLIAFIFPLCHIAYGIGTLFGLLSMSPSSK